MADLHKMTVDIYLTTDDPEGAAATMDGGLESQLDSFPGGTVLQVDVEGITPVSDDEAREKGLLDE